MPWQRNNDDPFVNPYTFIPLDAAPPVRKKIEDWKTGETVRGWIEYTITTKTPVSCDEFYMKNNLLPATEIRHIVRQGYEVLTNSCLSSLDLELRFRRLNKTVKELVGNHAPCNGPKWCPACALFGPANLADSSEDAFHFASRIRFENPHLKQSCNIDTYTIQQLSNPNPQKYWYIKNENSHYSLSGRKFYFLHTSIQSHYAVRGSSSMRRCVLLYAYPVNISFSGRIFFDGITPDELAILIDTVDPGNNSINDYQYFHNIGKAKPYGFGRISVKVSKINVIKYNKIDLGNLKVNCDSFKPIRKMSVDDNYPERLERLQTIKKFSANQNIHYPISQRR